MNPELEQLEKRIAPDLLGIGGSVDISGEIDISSGSVDVDLSSVSVGVEVS
jgi:hypothetical protein